jgi:hypothetical protein
MRSGGETRTLNLAGPPDEDSEQHQLEYAQLDGHMDLPWMTAHEPKFRSFAGGSRATLDSYQMMCERRRRPLTMQQGSDGWSPPVEGGMAQAVLLETCDPVFKVLAHHYGRSFGKVHAVGRGNAAGAPGVKYLFDCLVRNCRTIR